jgi:WD40 repeat protein
MNLAGESSSDHRELLYVGFNQDAGCFAAGTTDGFIIYNVDPFRETFRRIFTHGGIGIVEMLFRCNLLAIVGGGRNPRYPTNKVMIWDDRQNKCIGELKFRTEVKAVKLRRDRIVVVLESKVFVYRFKDLQLLDQITTVLNPKGLVSLCPEMKNNVLAVPGLAKGTIRIELYDLAKATLIKAHDTELAQFALNVDGSRIASSSEKGTLIRIWNTHTSEPLRELRRGMDRADIYCLAFNSTSTYLACSSDKGTVHIFSLVGPPPTQATGPTGGGENPEAPARAGGRSVSTDYPPPAGNTPSPATASSSGTNSNAGGDGHNKNVNSGLNFLKGFLPTGFVPKYFESEWSFAQIRGIEGKSICAFSKDASKLHVISADGNFIVANVEEGECSRYSTTKFLQSIDESTVQNLVGTDDDGEVPTPATTNTAPLNTNNNWDTNAAAVAGSPVSS